MNFRKSYLYCLENIHNPYHASLHNKIIALNNFITLISKSYKKKRYRNTHTKVQYVSINPALSEL